MGNAFNVFRCINSPRKVSFLHTDLDDSDNDNNMSDSVIFNKGSFREHYVLGNIIRPKPCYIRKCKNKKTEEIRSVKIIKKQYIDEIQ